MYESLMDIGVYSSFLISVQAHLSIIMYWGTSQLPMEIPTRVNAHLFFDKIPYDKAYRSVVHDSQANTASSS